MSSFAYNGHDFSGLLSAELVEPAALRVTPETAQVPGRPGLLLTGGALAPLVLRLRVFADAAALGSGALAEGRMAMRSWLLAPGGAALRVPGEPGIEWRDAVLTGASGWSSLSAGGSAELEFTCHDPIAWGRERSSSASKFRVGGTWETWPVVELVPGEGAASAGVVDEGAGEAVWVDADDGSALSDLGALVLDFAAETCAAGGLELSRLVRPASSFFALAPGERELSFPGCASHSVTWRERWA